MRSPLSKEEIELFTKWIDQGAQWGVHWAYIPPVKTELPEVNSIFEENNFLQTPMDYFIAARMEDSQLQPNVEASPVFLQEEPHSILQDFHHKSRFSMLMLTIKYLMKDI